MENQGINKKCEITDFAQAREERGARRQRSMTVLKLQVLAERIRKIEGVKRALAAGTYNVSSEKIARAMLALDQEEETTKE